MSTYIYQFVQLLNAFPVPCFDSLVGIAIGISSCPIGLTICVITTGIKKYKWIIKKKKKKYDKILLSVKFK